MKTVKFTCTFVYIQIYHLCGDHSAHPVISYTFLSSGRLQALKQPVYTQKEAEMAAGMGDYVLKTPDTNFSDMLDIERTEVPDNNNHKLTVLHVTGM